MGSFANSLFKIMLSWFQTAVSAVWSAFTSQKGSSLFNWIGDHWILAAGILCCIGLAADLCVYLFRWKPYKVWKSFLTRRQEPEESPDEAYAPDAQATYEPRPARRPEVRHVSVPEKRIPDAIPQEPDFSRWEDEAAADVQEVYAEEEPPTVTNAGYVVPADSPYRRPTTEASADYSGETEPESRKYETYTAEREAVRPAPPKRRRRLNVSDLFADPEEEIQQFEAPQHLIDSRKAYRKPVYPRDWENKEENTK